MKLNKITLLASVAVAQIGAFGFRNKKRQLALANATENSSGYRTLQATAVAIAQGARVKIDSNGLISVAAAAEAAVGVVVEAIAASGWGNVKLFSAPGSFIMIASVAITRGTQVFPAAAGKIAASGTTALNLVNLEASTADGDMIECLPVQKGA